MISNVIPKKDARFSSHIQGLPRKDPSPLLREATQLLLKSYPKSPVPKVQLDP